MSRREMKKLFPIFLNLENKNVLIIGGGNVALEKLTSLLNTNAKITIIAKEIKEEIREIASENTYTISIIEREALPYDLESDWQIVFLATNNSLLNYSLRSNFKSKNQLFNTVDDPSNCDFYSAAILDRGYYRIAISTDGKFAGFAGMLKRILDKILPKGHKEEFQKIINLRSEIKLKIANQEERKKILQKLIQTIENEYF